MRPVLACLLALALAACATYREDLNRGQRLYEENEYEHALAIWRLLEEDMDSLELTDQARYAYLRGMTGYRLGFRPDARHWLAIAKAIEQEHPGGLSPQWKQRLEEALADLNRDVFGGAELLPAPGAAPPPPPPGMPPGPVAPAQCAADTDCPPGARCQTGICVGP
jgi:Cys-rich repeat protein